MHRGDGRGRLRRGRLLAGVAGLAVLGALPIVVESAAAAPSTKPPGQRPGALPAAVVANVWSRVSNGPSLGISEKVSVARIGDALLVGWTQGSLDGGGGQRSLMTRRMGATGTWGPPVAAVSSWGSLGDATILRTPDGGTAVFTGSRTAQSTDPYADGIYSAGTTDGVAWTLTPGCLSSSGLGAYDTAAAYVRGVLTAAWSVTGEARFAYGTRQPCTAPTPTTVVYTGDAVNNAVAAAGGGAWQAWTRVSDGAVMARRVTAAGDAQVLGPISTAPGSAGARVRGNLPLVVPDDGADVTWTAFPRGAGNRIRLWRVGTALVRDIPTATAAWQVAMSHVGGRLWLAWSDNGSPSRIHAMRSNASATVWGAPVSVGQPRGGDTVWRLDVDGTSGPLDVAVSAGRLPDTQVWHVRLLPGLTATATPRTLPRRGGKVVVRVTDAGDPVAGATVRVAGLTASTGAAGTATLTLPATQRATTRPVTAAKPGYTTGRTQVSS